MDKDIYVIIKDKKVNLTKCTILAYNNNLPDTLLILKTRKYAYILAKSKINVDENTKLNIDNITLIAHLDAQSTGNYLIDWKNYEAYEKVQGPLLEL